MPVFSAGRQKQRNDVHTGTCIVLQTAFANVFMRAVVFCVGGCLSALLGASVAIIVSLTVILHLISLDVADDDVNLQSFIHPFKTVIQAC